MSRLFFFLFSTRSLLWFQIELCRCVRSMEQRNCLLPALVIIGRRTWIACLASTAKFWVFTWTIRKDLHSWNSRRPAKLSKPWSTSIKWKWMVPDFESSMPSLRKDPVSIDVHHRGNVRARPIITISCRFDSEETVRKTLASLLLLLRLPSKVTANRMSALPAYRQNYYQPPHPSMLMNSAAMSRGRSLTPPSFKQNARTSSMRHHLRPDDFYSPYPPNLYMDPAYYRSFDDPYAMQRLQPFPSSMIPPSSAHPYGHLYASANFDRRPPGAFQRRSRSPTRRRYELRLVSSVSIQLDFSDVSLTLSVSLVRVWALLLSTSLRGWQKSSLASDARCDLLRSKFSLPLSTNSWWNIDENRSRLVMTDLRCPA